MNFSPSQDESAARMIAYIYPTTWIVIAEFDSVAGGGGELAVDLPILSINAGAALSEAYRELAVYAAHGAVPRLVYGADLIVTKTRGRHAVDQRVTGARFRWTSLERQPPAMIAIVRARTVAARDAARRRGYAHSDI